MASALQAQLAALNGTAGKHPGSTLAPTKRHEEAVGRGVDFNVQQGQVVYHKNDIRFRATIMYDSPKQAADVPLSALEENCQEALTFLAEILPSLASTGAVLCGTDEASHSYIQLLLTRITILLGENDTEVTQNCLRVVEYLLRRYEIHRHLMEDFVWTFFPYHQQLTNVWHRCLLLVDLASHPSYLWLRPYADANRPAPTPRPLAARRVTQEIPLLRRLVSLVRKTAMEPAMEVDDASNPLRGWSHVFSWTATYLVDGLVWQQKEAKMDREALARILVPAVRLALQGETEDYSSWGCVVASTMTECLDLSMTVLAQWGTALLGNASIEPATAWSALASMLLAGQDPNRIEEDSYLPLIQLQEKNQWIGCPLPAKLFAAMTPDCAVTLGSLYRELEVTPLVVAVLVKAIRSDERIIATSLLEADDLANLWKGHDLVSSIAAYIVQMVAKEELVELPTGRDVLRSLSSRFGPTACEKGVASVASSVHGKKLKSLIKGIVTLVSTGSKSENTDILPPRVALEHPDVEVRHKALARLIMVKDSYQGPDDMDDGETLMETLVRRWSVEPDVKLALKLAELLVDADLPLITIDRSAEQCREVLNSAYHWMSTDKRMQKFLSKIVAKAVKEASDIGESGPSFYLLQEAALCLVGHSAATTSTQVLDALEDSEFLRNLVNNFGSPKGQDSENEDVTRKGCAWTLLAALSDPKHGKMALASIYVQICVHVLRSQSSLNKSHRQIAEKSLSRVSTLLSDSPSQLVDTLAILANLDGKEVANVIAPKLRGLASSVRDPSGNEVTPLAVLMEAATRPGTSSFSTKKLLEVAQEIIVDCSGSEWVCLIPSLSLLSHPDKEVRESSLSLLSVIFTTCHSRQKGDNSDKIEALSICPVISDEASSIAKVGTSLASLLGRCLEQEESEKVSVSLLELAVNATSTSAKLTGEIKVENLETSSWLPFDAQTGTRGAGCSVLEEMELAGEDAFSLINRWKYSGKPMLAWLLSAERSGIQTKDDRIGGLVSRMLKGVTISRPQVVISSGPDHGGARSRSYSVGNLEDAAIIRPYPDDMVTSIVEVVEKSVHFRGVVADTVLSSTSWSRFVFPSLDSTKRKRIVQSLLKAGSDNDFYSLIAVASSLRLDSNEMADLVGNARVAEDSFSYLAVLADYLKANASRMVGKHETGVVIEKLFDKVRELSTLGDESDQDGVEYLLQFFLKVIRDLLGEKPGSLSSDSVSSWVGLILSLLGAPREPSLAVTHLLKTWRGRAVSLSILTSIASFDPEAVVESVADLALGLVSRSNSSGIAEARSILLVSVPLLWSNVSSTSRTFVSFLKDLLGEILEKESETRNILLRDITRALYGTVNVDEEYRNLAPGLLSAVLVAMKSESLSQTGLKEIVVLIFESSPVIAQVISLPFMVALSRQVLGHVLGSFELESSSAYLPSSSDIVDLIGTQDKEHGEHAAAFRFISDTLSVVSECAILDNVQKLLRKRSTAVAASSLQLWQNLLLIHATAEAATMSEHKATLDDAVSWGTVATLAEESRESIQANIPSNVFIAAVRSLLKESVTADLRSRALRLASDRVLGIDPGSQDRFIFLDFLSDATELARSQTEGVRVRQGALVCVEHTIRSLLRPVSEGTTGSSAFQKLMHVLSMCSDIVKSIVENENLQDLDIGKWHLLTSVALACTTIIRIIGIKALPRLALLLKAFTEVLSHVNGRTKSRKIDDDGDSFCSLIQIAVLRLVLSATQTAPQSVFVQLPALLSGSGLFSTSIRTSEDPSVRSALESVDDALAASIPARLMIPCHVKLICEGTDSPQTMMHVFQALSKTVERLEGTEGGLYRASITKAALKSFECQCSQGEKQLLIERTNECLLGLVLKLSELQFRKMYGELSEWMRQVRAERRYPFWFLSEVLSKELKSLFMPCASLAFDDIVKDLAMFAGALLNDERVEIVHGGKKKRKKSDAARVTWTEESSSSLVPALATVKSILLADAQDGGKWTREHGRYQMLLEPLIKFIKSHIPSTFCPPNSSASPYEYVVEENSRGNVVECLTALALAAGDEQLWKPLNHAVLDACGNPSRPEVRKAGVVCLLSLIRTLGEEYMVLLPECLPVLSELLEDENEVVTGLARDAVTTAEDLLGESLDNDLK
eukprot:scaffold528_cov165-Amphora_coffeaeformis.AAC.5